MGAQNGKDLLIKVDLTGDGQFETMAGLRATRVSFNAESVDVTTLESQGGWRELLAGAGVKSANISGSGVFKDASTDERARQIFFDGETPEFQVIIPDFGTVEGAFQVTSIEYAGAHNGEATFEVAMASAGQLQFTPVPVA
ncbi:MAG: phage major tail protein, TP901-1 family [Paracoccaceae bacterium]|nr:phage major tail protein, TP901-1 family [Paracoccaceae bacterium]